MPHRYRNTLDNTVDVAIREYTLWRAIDAQYHYFQVIAHTTDPAVFFTSNPDGVHADPQVGPYQVTWWSQCPPLAREIGG